MKARLDPVWTLKKSNAISSDPNRFRASLTYIVSKNSACFVVPLPDFSLLQLLFNAVKTNEQFARLFEIVTILWIVMRFSYLILFLELGIH